jgi:Transposase DDE domain
MPARRVTATRLPHGGAEWGEAAKLIYRLRGQTAEWVNAQCRNRGLRHMPVRGQPRCRIIALLFAIGQNLFVAERLRLATAKSAV